MSIVAPILEPPAYAHVFARWRGAKAREFWGPGNVGDLLIRRGAEQLYAAYGITICDKDEKPDVVFYGGGGNMGPLYPGTRLTRLDARATATALGVPLIVLPQSWTGPEDFDADQIFARENRSLEYCPRAVLAPDLGLAYAPAIELHEPQHDVGWFMRDDCERHQSAVAMNCGDPAVLAATVEDYLRIASSYRVIHTDRLHFAIAAMIVGREAHLYANSYFKNEAMLAQVADVRELRLAHHATRVGGTGLRPARRAAVGFRLGPPVVEGPRLPFRALGKLIPSSGASAIFIRRIYLASLSRIGVTLRRQMLKVPRHVFRS